MKNEMTNEIIVPDYTSQAMILFVLPLALVIFLIILCMVI